MLNITLLHDLSTNNILLKEDFQYEDPPLEMIHL